MGELRLYDVTVGQHKSRMRLDDHDAKEMGVNAVLVRPPPSLAEPPNPTPPAATRLPYKDPKSRPVINKMRSTGESDAHDARGAN